MGFILSLARGGAHEVLWIVLFTYLVIRFRDRLGIVISVALGLWIFIPAIGVPLFTGPPLLGMYIHPAVLLVIVATIVQYRMNGRLVMKVIGQRLEIFLMLGLVGVIATMLALVGRAGIEPLFLVVERFVAPGLLFTLIGIALRRDHDADLQLRKVYIGFAAIQSALAMAQSLTGTQIFYVQQFQAQSWINKLGLRWEGTLDHPLVLSLFISLAIPLIAGLRSPIAPLILLPWLMGGLLLTQSRSGLVFGAVGCVYVLMLSRVAMSAKLMTLIGMMASVGYVVFSGGLTQLIARIENDTGSAEARSLANRYFVENIDQFLWLGGGLGSSYTASSRAGLATSFENSFIMLAVDLGFSVAVVYYVVMLVCVWRIAGRGVTAGLTLSGVVAIVFPLGFSALAAPSASLLLVWTIFALCCFSPRRYGVEFPPPPVVWSHDLERERVV